MAFGSLQPTAAGGVNARFVDQVYRDLLNRQAEPAGLAFWLNQLNQGMTRAQVVAGIEASTEFQTDVVPQAYQQFLHRAAEPASLNFWVSFLQQGHTPEQLEAGIVGLQEYFQNRGGGTSNGFLNALNRDALHRAIDASGMATVTQALAWGTTPGQVAVILFNSRESLQDVVQGFYGSLLHRAADNACLNAFVNAMQQGATDQQVLAAIAGSDEFFANL